MYFPCCDRGLATPDWMTGTSVLDKEADFKLLKQGVIITSIVFLEGIAASD